MDKIRKFIKKLPKGYKLKIESLIVQIINKDFSNLDVKKMQGIDNIYRVRKGDIRVVYLDSKNLIEIKSIGWRDESTYNF